jgi:hypothetical protein
MTTRISTLPSLATVTDATIIPVVEGGATKKITGAALKTYTGTAAGPQGPSGPSGAAGSNGASGPSGPSGPGTLNSGTAGYVPYYTGSAALSAPTSGLLFWDNTNARLGVGTTSPLGRLQIGDVAQNSVQNDLYLVGDRTNAAGYFSRLMFKNSTQASGSSASIRGERDVNNNGTMLTFYTQSSSAAGDGSERVRIDSAGRMYVGAVQPTTDSLFTSTLDNTDSGAKTVCVRAYIRDVGYPGTDQMAAVYANTNSFNTRYGVYAITNGNYGANYAGYFVHGGESTIDCASVYAEGKQIDSNGNAIISALYGFGKTTIGINNNGYAIAVYARTNDYVNNINIVASSDYTGSSTQTVMRVRRNGSNIGSITTTATATAYNTSSDYRLKNSIAPITGALARVALLKPCTYKWNSNGEDGEGFIAHELAEVCPHAVTGEKDAINVEQYVIEEEQFDVKITPAEFDANGNEITPAKNEKIVTKPAVMGSREVPVYQAIDTSFLVATLTAAIQELKAEFDAYKAAHP